MEGFELILDKDESIVKTYKPNRKRFVLINIIGLLIFFLIPIALLIVGILGSINTIEFVDEAGNPDPSVPVTMLAVGCLFALGFIVAIVGLFLRYHKTLYCITNKRIIIRHGFIGVDFKSLNLTAISGVFVQVDFADKFIKPNTGTITFASSATPIIQGSQKNGYVPFAFAHVDNPYEVYREVKGFVDEANS